MGAEDLRGYGTRAWNHVPGARPAYEGRVDRRPLGRPRPRRPAATPFLQHHIRRPGWLCRRVGRARWPSARVGKARHGTGRCRVNFPGAVLLNGGDDPEPNVHWWSAKATAPRYT